MSSSTIRFSGPLGRQFNEFSELMLATGAPHAMTLAVVLRLDHFLTQEYPEETALTREMLESWFASFAHLKATSQARYRTATFQLCKFLRSRDPQTATRENFVPLRRSRDFKPYILSLGEVAVLLRAARALRPRPCDPLWPARMELIVGLLYTTGLRIGEVVRLQVRDYDPEKASLTIRETKFAKSRVVPLSNSARRLVETYITRRTEVGRAYSREDPLLCGPYGRRPCLGSIQSAITKLMRRCGVKPQRGRKGPRIHDVRHTFAVHRILQWYQEGRDVQALLPRLVTYMGHRGLESTQLYLSVTPDVLQEASTRFQRFAGRQGESEVKA
jgi:site-specific recombinase XerD